jgi:2-dehydro-3-deoxyphosphogluconate aldolase/(4S)-4-hydroxy-2-oxoglutarate aldolase
MMSYDSIFSKLRAYGVIPVIAIENEESALPLADALIKGGLPVADITFRTPAAASVIKLIHNHRPEVLLGAGTILNVDNLSRAKQSGASFGVAPGLNPIILQKANQLNFPFIPGVMTPTDIEKALSMETNMLKFFPAEASGGLKMIQALAGPYRHAGVQYMPTGGVNLNNLSEYLKSKDILCVGGTWIAPSEAISAGDWSRIQDNCRKTIAIVRTIRGESVA